MPFDDFDELDELDEFELAGAVDAVDPLFPPAVVALDFELDDPHAASVTAPTKTSAAVIRPCVMFASPWNRPDGESCTHPARTFHRS